MGASRWPKACCVAALLAAAQPGGAAPDTPETDRLVTSAETLAGQGELRAAVTELDRVLQRDPTHRAARLLLAGLHARLNDWAAAEREYRQARALGAPAADWKPGLAETLLAQGRHDALLDTVAVEPGDSLELRATVLALRGQAQLGRGDRIAARAAFTEALALQPGHERARLGLAALLMAEGQRDAGLAELDALLAEAPGSTPARLLRAETHRQDGRLDAAAADYGAILAADPGDLRARVGRALVLLAQHRPDDAERDLDALPARLRDQPGIRYLLAMLAYQRDDLGQAAAHLDQALRTSPQLPQAVLLYGAVSYARGDYQLADDLLARLAAMPDPPVMLHTLRAAVRLKLGRPHDAIRVLEEALRRAPDDPQLLALLGSAYMQAGEPGKGTEALVRAVELDPDQAALRTQLALGRLASGDPGAATSELQAAVDLGQDLLQADILLVLTHLQAGRHDEAARAAMVLEERLPGSPVPANLRGLVLLAQKDLAGADAAFAQALERDATYVVALVNRARVSLAAGRHDEAVARYEAVRALQPDHLGALLGLAAIAEQRGDAAAARHWLEQARAAHPTVVQPALLLAQRALRQGDPARALSLLDAIPAEAAGAPAVQLLRGVARLAAGDPQGAVRTLQDAAAARPESIEARFQLGRAQLAAGDAESARASFDRAVELDAGKRLPPLRAAQVELEIREKQPARALELARAAQRDFPDAVELVDLEAAAARQMDDRAAALDAARRALERQPTGRRAAAYAQLLVAAERRADAIASLRTWLADHPEDAANRTLLGLALHQAGERAAAVVEYEQVLAARPDDVGVVNNLAVLYQETGDPRALDAARRAYELAPQRPEMIDTYGWTLVRNGRVQEGLTLLQQAYVMAPQHPEIAYHVGAALVQAGRAAEARPILERVVREHGGTQSAREAEALLRASP